MLKCLLKPYGIFPIQHSHKIYFSNSIEFKLESNHFSEICGKSLCTFEFIINENLTVFVSYSQPEIHPFLQVTTKTSKIMTLALQIQIAKCKVDFANTSGFTKRNIEPTFRTNNRNSAFPTNTAKICVIPDSAGIFKIMRVDRFGFFYIIIIYPKIMIAKMLMKPIVIGSRSQTRL